MTTNNEKLFHQAIFKNELWRLLIGDPPYYFESKSGNEEPQDVQQAFDLSLLPYWKRTKAQSLPCVFCESLAYLITNYEDKNRAIYTAIDWIWYYTYCLEKIRSNPEAHLEDIFLADIGSVAPIIKKAIEERKEELIADKRWAGAPWNSSAGLWEPIVRTAKAIRDNLGGADVVPSCEM